MTEKALLTQGLPSMGAETLAEALPREMARVRDEVLPMYVELLGMPRVHVETQIKMMRAELDEAAQALVSGDVVRMLRIYTILKECWND